MRTQSEKGKKKKEENYGNSVLVWLRTQSEKGKGKLDGKDGYSVIVWLKTQSERILREKGGEIW